MHATAGQFAVINAQNKPPFFRDVAEALNMTGMHRIDAMQRAKDRPFIFITEKQLGQAQAIWQHLAQVQVDSLVVPMDYFTYFPAAYPLSNANCLSHCFEVESPRLLQIPWEQVAMISYGRIRTTVIRPKHVSLPGTEDLIITGHGGYRHHSMKVDPGERRATEEIDVLDIFIGYLSDDDFAARFRVQSDRFYYDYLNDRLQSNSRLNFLLFAQDIQQYAPNLVVTDSAKQLLMGTLNLSQFDGFAEFDQYCLWQTALARARAAGEI